MEIQAISTNVYTWALDVEKASAYESFITAYPHIVEIINYDQTAIEGYNAILVEVTTPEGLDEAGSLDREQFLCVYFAERIIIQRYSGSNCNSRKISGCFGY